MTCRQTTLHYKALRPAARLDNHGSSGGCFVMKEIWKAILGWEGRYEVSNFGRIKGFRNGKNFLNKPRIIKPYLTKKKYKMITFSKNNKNKYMFVSRLVLTAFVGKCLPGLQASHLDGNKTNNHIDNLIWESSKANNARRILHGTSPVGEKNPKCVLTEKKAIKILDLYSSGIKPKDIAKIIGAKLPTVSSVCYRQSWKYLDAVPRALVR